MLRTFTIFSIGIETIISFLTTQVEGRLSLLHPPKEVGEEVVQGLFLQAQVHKNLQWSQVLLCHWPGLSHWCHSWAWGPITAGSRPHAPEVLASIFCKSCTRSLHLLPREEADRLGCIKRYTELKKKKKSLIMRKQTAQLCCNLTFLTSPAALPSSLSASLSSLPSYPFWFSISSNSKHDWEGLGNILSGYPSLKALLCFQKVVPTASQSFVIAIRTLWSILFHPHSLNPAVSPGTPRSLPGYPSQTHLDQTFWASRTSSAFSL